MATLSRSVEDYLKAIHVLSERDGSATTNEIADRLAVTAASVTKMVKRLAESGHLRHEPYRGARLTDQGRTAALGVVRRHRILETYLTSKLGYDWSNVHGEAERLEHSASEELIERMSRALGQPKYDPHGEPIPTPGGEIERPLHVSLDQCEIGVRAFLRQVGEHDPERLRYLKRIGLVPGAAITVVDRQPLVGTVTLRVGNHEAGGRRNQVIGLELAKTLLVEQR